MGAVQEYTQQDLAEYVILVDEQDRQVGIENKIEAHRQGLLHRAFSVLIYSSDGKMLIQQRAMSKYHGKGEWANAACGHPRPGERICAAARRRLNEEMGIDVPTLHERLTYVYRAPMKEGLVEHEFLHVLVGECNAAPAPDPAEVMNYAWMYPEAINAEIVSNPGKYAYWFRETMHQLYGQGRVY